MGALALTKSMTILSDPVRRNVLLLAICQAVSSSGTSMLAAVAALVGYSLVDDKSFATLPLAFQWTATMATTIPAAQLMRRFGRRAGLSLGAIIFMTGGALGVWSIWIANFYVFIAACVCVGSAMSFVHYYRFAAADSAPEDFKSKAISLVLAGGIVAAVMGGELAKLSVDWFEPLLYAGCYATIILLGLAVLIILQGVRIPTLTAEQRRSSGWPLLTIARQPVFMVAVLASALSYAAMIMIMTATPLAMQACGFEFHDTATVIQACAGDVSAELLHRIADRALRRAADHRDRRRPGQRQPGDEHIRHRLFELLGRSRPDGAGLELHVRRRQHAADRGLYGGGTRQGAGHQRFHRIFDDRGRRVQFGRAAG
jgi:MFS family permease